jgi:hypothetical protein
MKMKKVELLIVLSCRRKTAELDAILVTCGRSVHRMPNAILAVCRTRIVCVTVVLVFYGISSATRGWSAAMLSSRLTSVVARRRWTSLVGVGAGIYRSNGTRSAVAAT